MARAPKYTLEDHRKAFLCYQQTRNYAECAKSVNAAVMTIYRWASENFNCSFNCNFHHWDKILADISRASAARLELINSGVSDPAAIDSAMRGQITVKTSGNQENRYQVATTDHPAMEIIRKNDLIVGDFEHLYAKLYFLATGVVIRPEHALATVMGEEIDYADLYQKGLKVNNLKDAIEAMIRLRQEIDKKIQPENGMITLEQTKTTQAIKMPLEDLIALREKLLETRKQTGRGVPDEDPSDD